ncbi:MAG: GntR family transcriptional regulator [Anaerolineae bacterium]|nr:MAG: GntR family transcriptional regulator [Anaerolineae bacterium]
MIAHDSHVPLYIQIKDYIRLNIQAGVFPENSRIPSERQLAEQFQVSRLTVSKAINELIQEGLLHSHVGKGTFVSSTKIEQELRTLTSFTEEMIRRGQRPSSRVLYAAVEPASSEVTKALLLPSGTKIIVLRRVRLADNQPVALETSAIVAAICPGIVDKHDFSQESLYQVLREECGIRIAYARQTFESRQATPEEQEALHLDPHTPILGITRVTYNAQEQPIEYVRSAYRGDRYKFNAILRYGE